MMLTVHFFNEIYSRRSCVDRSDIEDFLQLKFNEILTTQYFNYVNEKNNKLSSCRTELTEVIPCPELKKEFMKSIIDDLMNGNKLKLEQYTITINNK